MAELLGVRYILSGTMQGFRRSRAHRGRAHASRTPAPVIWAERFDGQRSEIFELQDRLSEDIAHRVVPYVRQVELERARARRPENLTAYERTLRAIDHLHRNSPDDLRLAHALLEAAIDSDPLYAAPHACLAFLHVRRVGQGWSSDVAIRHRRGEPTCRGGDDATTRPTRGSSQSTGWSRAISTRISTRRSRTTIARSRSIRANPPPGRGAPPPTHGLGTAMRVCVVHRGPSSCLRSIPTCTRSR